MAKTKQTETTVQGIKVRPFVLEYQVIAHIEKDGKIVDTASAKDKIMESNFNGTTIEAIVETARQALIAKIGNG